MAYNHKRNVYIVDTENWEVKKTLTDEMVMFSVNYARILA